MFLRTSKTCRAKPSMVLARVLVALVPIMGCGREAVEPQASEARKVILISLDTLRADHLGCYGYERPTSPVIDGLAGQGVRFERAYTNASYTLPAHMCLLTGLYPESHGVLTNEQVLPEDRTTLAELLSERGVRTAAFADGGLVGRRYGFDHGFETFEEPDKAFRGFAWSLPRVKQWLDENGHRDYFLFVHTYDIHGPYLPPEPYQGHFQGQPPGLGNVDPTAPLPFLNRFPIYQRWHMQLDQFDDLYHLANSYDDGIRYADEKIGELLAHLGRLGIDDQTWIIVASDHGENLFDNEIYLGHRWFLYESEARIPLIVRPPRPIRPAVPVIDDFVEIVDIFPTIAEIFGVSSRPPVQGRSLMSYVREGTARQPRNLVVGYAPDTHQLYVRNDQWKFLSRKDPAGFRRILRGNMGAERGWDPWPERAMLAEELYHTRPGEIEHEDVIAENPEIARRARRAIAEWRAAQYRFNREVGFSEAASEALTDEEYELLRRLGYIGEAR